MSEHYHDVGDLRFLKEMGKLAPTEFNAWLALDNIVSREEGAIPRKYRELLALAVAFTTQCPYCIEVHVKGAKIKRNSEARKLSLRTACLLSGGLLGIRWFRWAEILPSPWRPALRGCA